MRLRYHHNGIDRTVELSEGLEGYTVADLADALIRVATDASSGGGCACGTDDMTFDVVDSDDNAMGVIVDGCWYAPGTPLESVVLWVGSLIETATVAGCEGGCDSSPGEGSSPGSHPQKQSMVLAITGGLRSGVSLDPPPQHRSWVIGRSASCDVVLDDPSVSRRHARVVAFHGGCPVIDDLGSRNGVAVSGRATNGPTLVSTDDVVRLGATRLEWRAAVQDVPAAVRAGFGATAGRVPFNRPPRRMPQMSPTSLRVPAQPPSCPQPEPLSWISIVLPIVAGLVMALVWSPFMAVFAILGPMLTIGTWLERRRRATKTYKKSCDDVAEQVANLVASLPAVRVAERRRRVSLVPDPSEIVRRACAPSVRCWERRLSDPDAMKLGIGTADVAWTPSMVISNDLSDKGDPSAKSNRSTTGNSSAENAVAADDALTALADMGPIEDVPVAVSLMPGEVVGIVGPLAEARSVARSLVLQAAVLHGPADLAIIGLAPNPDGSGGSGWNGSIRPGHHGSRGKHGSIDKAWDWMRWLPHTVDTGGEALVATDTTAMAEVAEAVRADTSPRMRLLVIDGVGPLTGRSAPGRALLGCNRTAGIVVVEDTHNLPAACTTVVEVWHSAGGLRLINPSSNMVLEPLVAWGMTVDVATNAAACLARLDDCELGAANSNLPSRVPLVDLIGSGITPETVLKRWSDTRRTAKLIAPIGANSAGPVEVDLVADGPHMLVGGTTGSGKSELLRSLVAGLALSADPELVAFVLVDYKGGAAFDRCADMPHVAGMVTDLDDRLAERALLCLEAELRYREQRLREAGVEDLAAFQAWFEAQSSSHDQAADRGRFVDPLPRLVVVVDEFATLAAELPEFLDALVGIAQRGRSLGVHMVLATQRPAGVVTEDIRANTSCRIALRVTDRHDSNDVIGSPDAAAIPRRWPGRALARFGPDELVAFQTALVTCTTPPASAGLRITVVDEPHSFNGISNEQVAACVHSNGIRCASTKPGRHQPPGKERSDLDSVVDAVRAAHESRGGRPPRSPWPAPLPDEISSEALIGKAGPEGRAAWLVDDPARQQQFTGGWRPDDGHLVVIGRPDSGTSTTLASVALDLCRSNSPEELHLYAIDFDGELLSVLNGLPHTGSVVHRSDSERRKRLLRLLENEIDFRRSSGVGIETHETVSGTTCDWPEIVLLVDDLAGLARAHDPVRDHEPHQRFARIWGNGPAVGVHIVVSIGRAADLPPELSATAGVVLVHTTTDIGDGLRFGLNADTSQLNPGRVIRASDGRELQIARPLDGDFSVAVVKVATSSSSEFHRRHRRPITVGVLPAVVVADDLPVSATIGDRYIDLSFAMSDLTLGPIGFTLHDGDHALVLGPVRSGRTSTLAAIGVAARQAGIEVLVLTDRPCCDLADLLRVKPVAVDVLCSNGDNEGRSCRRLILVDDADRIKDTTDRVLSRIAGDHGSRDHLVVAVTPDRLRSAYGYWLTELRSCRTGVLFRPGPLDGDLLGVSLPTRLQMAPRPGHGLIVADGETVVSQVACVNVTSTSP